VQGLLAERPRLDIANNPSVRAVVSQRGPCDNRIKRLSPHPSFGHLLPHGEGGKRTAQKLYIYIQAMQQSLYILRLRRVFLQKDPAWT